jgi:hypothetical protein
MVTQANLAALSTADLDWVTALKAPQVRTLKVAGALALSLFSIDKTSPRSADDFPGEQLDICLD